MAREPICITELESKKKVRLIDRTLQRINSSLCPYRKTTLIHFLRDGLLTGRKPDQSGIGEPGDLCSSLLRLSGKLPILLFGLL